jgi:hypothetical protein
MNSAFLKSDDYEQWKRAYIAQFPSYAQKSAPELAMAYNEFLKLQVEISTPVDPPPNSLEQKPPSDYINDTPAIRNIGSQNMVQSKIAVLPPAPDQNQVTNSKNVAAPSTEELIGGLIKLILTAAAVTGIFLWAKYG